MNNNTTWHYHHLVPRHAGGSDDKSNLVKVNVAMHAFLHQLRYDETGDEYDRIAAQSLRKQIGRQEATTQAVKEAFKRLGKEWTKSLANKVAAIRKAKRAFDEDLVRSLREMGWSYAQITHITGCPKTTIGRVVNE